MSGGMTVKQIAELAGVSRDSVERTVRDLYPALMEKGKTTVLDHAQSVAVMGSVRKANMVSLPQNAEVLPQNAEAATSMRALMLEMIPAMTAAMVAALRQVQPLAPSMLRQAQLALPAASGHVDSPTRFKSCWRSPLESRAEAHPACA